MGKKGTKRRVYSPEFKAGTAALIEKREKPVSQTAADLGVNENMLRKRAQKAHESAGDGLRAFPGRGRTRDEEPARLQEEIKALRNANEILKKAAAVFMQGDPQ
jgi:transposase-like protein